MNTALVLKLVQHGEPAPNVTNLDSVRGKRLEMYERIAKYVEEHYVSRAEQVSVSVQSATMGALHSPSGCVYFMGADGIMYRMTPEGVTERVPFDPQRGITDESVADAVDLESGGVGRQPDGKDEQSFEGVMDAKAPGLAQSDLRCRSVPNPTPPTPPECAPRYSTVGLRTVQYESCPTCKTGEHVQHSMTEGANVHPWMCTKCGTSWKREVIGGRTWIHASLPPQDGPRVYTDEETRILMEPALRDYAQATGRPTGMNTRAWRESFNMMEQEMWSARRTESVADAVDLEDVHVAQSDEHRSSNPVDVGSSPIVDPTPPEVAPWPKSSRIVVPYGYQVWENGVVYALSTRDSLISWQRERIAALERELAEHKAFTAHLDYDNGMMRAAKPLSASGTAEMRHEHDADGYRAKPLHGWDATPPAGAPEAPRDGGSHTWSEEQRLAALDVYQAARNPTPDYVLNPVCAEIAKHAHKFARTPEAPRPDIEDTICATMEDAFQAHDRAGYRDDPRSRAEVATEVAMRFVARTPTREEIESVSIDLFGSYWKRMLTRTDVEVAIRRHLCS